VSDLADDYGLRAESKGAARKGGKASAAKESFHRHAKKDGRRVVILRLFERDEQFVVECDVYPTNSLRVEPLHPGPYHFGSKDEAAAYIEEALLALEYLGCEVS
jgi:ribosomal protein S12 methylthiotransferase accessory factor YcaO